MSDVPTPENDHAATAQMDDEELWAYRTVGDGNAPVVWSAGDRPSWGHPGVREGAVVQPLWSAGGILRTARAYASLSQRELAACTGLAQSTISRIEAARTVPRWPVMFRCLRACGLTFALLAPDGEVIAHEPLLIDRDGAGRYYPAHLAVRRVGHWGQPWRYNHYAPDFRVQTPPFAFRHRRGDPAAGT